MYYQQLSKGTKWIYYQVSPTNLWHYYSWEIFSLDSDFKQEWAEIQYKGSKFSVSLDKLEQQYLTKII